MSKSSMVMSVVEAEILLCTGLAVSAGTSSTSNSTTLLPPSSEGIFQQRLSLVCHASFASFGGAGGAAGTVAPVLTTISASTDSPALLWARTAIVYSIAPTKRGNL
eukprot:CAMPEP_0197684442 /NCGR_PEP_ID=MMETSP1338-20131121/99512_1 /TAXON_ID=43686 ORGANISM="Pelagodinium beii, Strain RCC1491" /NCGR_SAMPLE_ID=MMETSP1338 /ASSEMBLY_ACC=CAM_ASM_000754 /LENGTH=105 /DNA_ID=CAMNT_0043266157 /DNA_START=14 /DNA_END=328 /DNA_ORIENTATION=-